MMLQDSDPTLRDMSSTPSVRSGAPIRPAAFPSDRRVARPAPIPAPVQPRQQPAKHDPRAFAGKVKLVAIGGAVAGFGVVWSLVAANAVGVTNRQATPADAPGANGVSGTQQGSGSFFQGAGVQAPSFAGNGSSGGSSVGSTGSSSGSASGSTSRKLPTVGGFGGFGNFGGPLVVSGSS